MGYTPQSKQESSLDADTLAVYLFETFDLATRSWKRSPSYATEAAIARNNGVILHSTMIQVAAERVGEDGFLKQRTPDHADSA